MNKQNQWRLLPEFMHLQSAFGSLDKIFALQGKTVTSERISDLIRVNHDGEVYYIKRYRGAGKGIRRFFGQTPYSIGGAH